MGERTPNLNLYKPSIVPLEIGWGEEVNGNFDKIDELLHGAAQSVYLIAGKVNYVANAVYTNGVWNRLNTGMGAVRLALDPSAQTITVYYAAAGANPISWTTLQTFSSGGLNAGAKKITNLATPTAANDAVTKAYVDTPTTNRSMNGKKITNLGTPTSSTDAATKAYIDGLIAALKLSQIAIDADKNWGGKSITNVGTLSAESLILPESPFTIVADITKNAKYLMISDDTETQGSSAQEWKLVKSLPPLPARVFGTENSVYVSYQHRSTSSATCDTRIYVNGEGVGTPRYYSGTSYTTWDEVITGLKAGDIIQIYGRAYDPAIPRVRNLRVYGGTFPITPMTPGTW